MVHGKIKSVRDNGSARGKVGFVSDRGLSEKAEVRQAAGQESA